MCVCVCVLERGGTKTQRRGVFLELERSWQKAKGPAEAGSAPRWPKARLRAERRAQESVFSPNSLSCRCKRGEPKLRPPLPARLDSLFLSGDDDGR